MGTLEVLCSAFSAVLQLKGVAVGVVYTGNSVILIFRSESVPTTDSNGKWMMRSRRNFDDDGARPVKVSKFGGYAGLYK